MRRTRIIAPVMALTLALAPMAGCSSAEAPSETTSEEATTEEAKDSEQQASIDYKALVNKQNKLPDGWEDAVDLVEEESLLYDDPVKVERAAYEAYQALKADLAAEDVHVELDSCYRSVAKQQEVWDDFMKQYGEEYTKTHVATPGYSEHHTGLALDLFLVVDGEQIAENEDMMKYPEIWEKIHAKLADHGFILRYLDGQQAITGYKYEPWHIRYIADEKAAHEIMDANITYEEYLGVAAEARAANAEAVVSAAAFEIDYKTSETYDKTAINEAIAAVMGEFDTWEGATMQRIAFTDDETCAENLEYANSLRDEGAPEFTEAIVLTSDFHSPSEEQAKNTAWEPDTDYKDYTWVLGRTDGGVWHLLTWGYE